MGAVFGRLRQWNNGSQAGAIGAPRNDWSTAWKYSLAKTTSRRSMKGCTSNQVVAIRSWTFLVTSRYIRLK